MQQTEIIWPRFENVYRNRSKFTEQLAFDILKKYTIIEPRALKHMWNGPGRSYHDWQHARFLMSLAAEMKSYIEQDCNFELLILAIMFHDVVYVPGSRTNEHMSAEFMRGVCKDDIPSEYKSIVSFAILQTDYGASSTQPQRREGLNAHPIVYWLQQLDLYQLIHGEALDLRHDQLINFIKVYHEFENRLLWNGIAKDEDKKATFEKGQNDFLTKLASHFKFPYRPITWAEIQNTTYRKDPIDLDEAID